MMTRHQLYLSAIAARAEMNDAKETLAYIQPQIELYTEQYYTRLVQQLEDRVNQTTADFKAAKAAYRAAC